MESKGKSNTATTLTLKLIYSGVFNFKSNSLTITINPS